MILESIAAALIPAAIKGIENGINKVTGPSPKTIEEQIQLDDQEIKRLSALKDLDNPGGTPSQWVIDLRASSRYIAAFVVIVGGLGTPLLGLSDMVNQTALEAVGIAFGFLFGSRIITKK